MLKKISIVLVLAFFLVLPVFAGGQGERAEEEGGVVELEFWNLFGGGDGETIVQIVEEYNEMNPNVNIANMTQDWGQYYTKLRTAVLGGTSPDLGVSHVTRLLELKSDKLIDPLESVANGVGVELDYSVYPQGMIDSVTFDGKRYAVPMDNLLFILLCNKNILSKYGLVDDNGNVALSDGLENFSNDLAKIKNGGDVPLAASIGGWPVATMWFTMYKQMNAGRFLAEDKKSVQWNEDKAFKAMTALNQLYENYVPRELDNPWELFKEGGSALYLTGPWDINQGVKVFGDDLDVVLLPRIFEESIFWTDSHSLLLPTNPDRTERQTKEAVTFIKWFAENNWRWARAGHIPASVEARQSEKFTSMPHRTNIAKKINVVSYPATENVWLTFAPELYEPIEKMLVGNTDPAGALQEAKQRLNSALSK